MSETKNDIQNMSNGITKIKENITILFKNEPNKVGEFTGGLLQIISSNEKLREMNINEVAAAYFQLWQRKVNTADGEGFIIPYKMKKDDEPIPITQIGYKYLIRRIWETQELVEMPMIFELRQGDLIGFDSHTRDVKYGKCNLKNYDEFANWKKKKIIGWVLHAKMVNGNIIEKFYWQEELIDHVRKYSKSYQMYEKFNKGIWKDNNYEMFRKTAFLRMANYLPKSKKISDALIDFNKLNLAHYKNIDPNEMPEYIDNPQPNFKNDNDKIINEKNPWIADHPAFEKYGISKLNVDYEDIKPVKENVELKYIIEDNTPFDHIPMDIKKIAWETKFIKNIKKEDLKDSQQFILHHFKLRNKKTIDQDLKYQQFNYGQIIKFNEFINELNEGKKDYYEWKAEIDEIEALNLLKDLKKIDNENINKDELFSEEDFSDLDI